MSDASYISKLQASIESYEAEILQNPEAKDSPLGILDELPPLPRERVIAIWRDLPAPPSLLGAYSHAKHGLLIFTTNHWLTEVSELAPRWVRACVIAGAYGDCIRFADECMSSDVLRIKIRVGEYLSVLFSRAKSLRNLGRFEEAQKAFREVIKLAGETNALVDLSFGLIFIGKLYGNYLGQRSLFSSFIEEAKRRLDELASGSEYEQEDIMRGIALCHDALGQAYRYGEHEKKVVPHFLDAIAYNKGARRASGLSRAVCHLNYLRFKHATNMQDKASYVEAFKKGMALLMNCKSDRQDPPDERGLAVRSIQYAEMLHLMGETRRAQQYIESGKLFARRYSQHKTFVEAMKVEAQMYRSIDPERAVRSLRMGLDSARTYKLVIQESDLNWLLADLSSTCLPGGESEPRPIELLKRNREIFMGLISEVQKTLLHLDSEDDLEPEFRLLSDETKSTFREKLLLDFMHIVEKMDRNFLSLLALRSGEEG